VVDTLIGLLTLGAALMTFEPVRQFGVSLFASAGVAGLVAGLAARPMLSNLIAGIQIATTQPIRIDDEVVIEGQWGRIQEITSTYVVMGLWDLRQLIVPLSFFIEKSFENWTRDSTELIGAVTFHVDYMVPIAELRAKVMEIVKASPDWDGKTVSLQVNDAKEFALELRVLASARSSGALGNLRLEIREKVIEFLQQKYPSCLPRLATLRTSPPDARPASAGPGPTGRAS
jgi:small-conductance mechanosensitive channel